MRFLLVLFISLVVPSLALANCGPWTGQFGPLADLSLQLPVVSHFGQSSLSLTCHQETPQPGILYPCQAFATTDILGGQGWPVQRLFAMSTGTARVSGSLLLDSRACPQYVAHYDPTTGQWTGYKAIR